LLSWLSKQLNMFHFKMARFPSHDHTPESISDMILNSIEAPHPNLDSDKLLKFIKESGVGYANYYIAVCFARDNLFFFEKNLKKNDFTLYNIIILSYQALYVYSVCWKVRKLYFNKILLCLEKAYYHYIEIDLIINYIIHNDD